MNPSYALPMWLIIGYCLVLASINLDKDINNSWEAMTFSERLLLVCVAPILFLQALVDEFRS
jgi:hypothetical protein